MLSIELWRPGAPQFAMCAVLGVAARLTVDETRTVFARWKPFSSSAVASPARPGPVAATILATSLEAPTDGPPNDPELPDERRHPCIDKPGTVSSADEAAIDKTDASIKTASNQPVQVREETNSGA